MKKKLLALLLLAALVLCILTGCGTTTSSSDTSSASTSASGTSSASSSNTTSDLDFPKQNITIIVPYGAGGTTDLTTRAAVDSVADGALPSGVNFVVENISGGSGLNGIESALAADTDGYTLAAVCCDLPLNRALGATEIVAEEEFIPLAMTQYVPYCLIVKSDSDVNSLENFINKVKSGNDNVTVAITGIGTPGGIACMAMQKYFGCSVKTVTYDSAANCVVAVASGEVDATFSSAVSAAGQVEAGELSILAVTSNTRSDSLPDVPAIGEVYPEASDMSLYSWITLAAPAGTDDAIVEYLRNILQSAVVSDHYAESIKSFYMVPYGMSSDEMLDFYKSQYEYYVDFLK
ncbi:MAG: tripartite tricarboxylate transporter substrate binding protein [Oscillospiraceae bacterium]